MDLKSLCINCMLEQVVNGACPGCGKKEGFETGRNTSALPSRTLLCGQYYIGKVLGNGGFGITYLAYDCKRNRRVAVKELFPCKDVEREQSGTAIHIVKGQESYFQHVKKRFLEEAEILYRFQQMPSIVNVFHYFEENNTAYYVMEYLEGTDLKHELRRTGKMDWNRMATHLKPILNALYTLHCQNFIHRDISPDNIFLTRDGRTMLIDFGSVRSYTDGQGFTTFLKECFAPYEQYRENGRQGPWTDIYALSVTLYYALAGVLPQKAPDRLLQDKTKELRYLRPELPGHVSQAVAEGMSVLPENRPQNIPEFAGKLFPGEQVTGRQAQGRVVRQREEYGRSQQPVPRMLICVKGYYRGKSWNLRPGAALTFGRDPRCAAPYPLEMPGISRHQCSVMLDRMGRLYVRDDGSTYGTYLNGRKLQASACYILTPGSSLSFAQEMFQAR